MFGQIWETLWSTIVGPSFWIGFVAVAYFAIARFNETATDVQELDPPILVRSFTTRFRYYFASCTYAALYCLVYALLVCLGAVPSFQDALQQWFGTLVSVKEHDIGTPIWAALLLTSVLPSVRLTKGVDDWVRLRLQNIASIPLKARFIADHVIANIAGVGADDVPDALEQSLQSPERRVECHKRLRGMIDTLGHATALRRAKSYKEFFANNRDLLDAISQKLELMLEGGREQRESLVAKEFGHQLRRMARLLACGMLSVEREEYAVRRTLRRQLQITGFERMSWRFKGTQIPLAIAAILITGLIAALISTYLGLNRVTIDDPNQWNALFGRYFVGFAIIILVSIPAFVLPFAFVTGVRMYLIDQKLFGTELEWDDVLLIYTFTFFGAFAFALFPTVLFGVVIAGSADEIPRALSIAPWALPTAFVALGYFFFSEIRLPIHKYAHFVLDLVVHAVPTALLAWIALQISTTPTPKAPLTFVFETLPPVPSEVLELSVTISAGILGGVLGAIQCAISRQ